MEAEIFSASVTARSTYIRQPTSMQRKDYPGGEHQGLIDLEPLE